MRLEHLFQALLGDPRTFVIDVQDKSLVVVFDVQMSLVTVLEGVVDQIAHAPA